MDKCPFEFNYDAAGFKVGDTVSYRVPKFGDMPFAATVVAVHPDSIEICDVGDPNRRMRATRESRPLVADDEALA